MQCADGLRLASELIEVRRVECAAHCQYFEGEHRATDFGIDGSRQGPRNVQHRLLDRLPLIGDHLVDQHGRQDHQRRDGAEKQRAKVGA